METIQQERSIQRTVLPNGMTLIAIANPAADIVSGRVFLKNAGTRFEPREKAGLFHLLAAVIAKGTRSLSAYEIADRVESVGAGLGLETTADYFYGSFKAVSADFAGILQLLGEILRYPSFPEAEVELEKHLAIQNIRAMREQPFNVALEALRQQLYPEHPYGLSLLGTEETVAALTQEDLESTHRTYFRPDNVVISVCGRLSAEEAIATVFEVFGDWQIPETPLDGTPLVSKEPQPSTTQIQRETQQAIVMLGYLVPGVRQRDYPVLKLMNTYLGSGLSSRLFVQLREKRGLAYEVSAFYPTRLGQSHFVTYMGTANENVEVAIAGLRQETERLCEELLSPEELQAAKNKLLGQYALGKQSNAQIAQIYGWYETLGLGIEYDTQFQETIAQMSALEMREVAQQYLAIAPYVSLVGQV